MKKNMVLFILAVILLVNSMPALSVAADGVEKVKALNVRIAKEYYEHGKFTAEDFPELDLESFEHPSFFEIKWSVADRNVAALGDRENNTDKCSGDVAKLTALKEGVTTLEVSYYNGGEEADGIYEIEVVSQGKENYVNTGEDNDIFYVLFIPGIAGLLFVVIFVLIKKKSICIAEKDMLQ